MTDFDPQHSIKPEDPLFVDNQLTPVSREELAFLLRSSWHTMFDQIMTSNQLGILWAHIFLEIGGGKFIHNHNFGNIKKLSGKKYTSYECSEVLKDKDGIRKEFKFKPYHPQTLFAAWDSAQDGILDYIKFIKKPQYKLAFDALIKEDLNGYVSGLKAGGYFTADLAAYTRAVNVWNLIYKQSAEKLYAWEPAPKLDVPEPKKEPETSSKAPETPTPAPEKPKDPEKLSNQEPSPLDLGRPISGDVKLSLWDHIYGFLLVILNFFRGAK